MPYTCPKVLADYFKATRLAPLHPSFFRPLRTYIREQWQAQDEADFTREELRIAYRNFLLGNQLASFQVLLDVFFSSFLILSLREYFFLWRKSIKRNAKSLTLFLAGYTKLIFIKLQGRFRVSHEKKKVVLLIGEFSRYGGTRTYIDYLIRWLNEQKVPYVFAAYSPIDEGMRNTLEAQAYTEKIIQMKAGSKKPLFLAKQQLAKLKKNYYFTSTLISAGNPSGELLPLLSIINTRKKTFILHTTPESPLFYSRHKALIKNRKEIKITAVSKASATEIKKYWYYNTKTHTPPLEVLYNPYEERKTLSTNRQKQSSLSILTIGSVIEYKNPFFWIAVAERVAKQFSGTVNFNWIGDGPLLEECKLYCQTRGLDFITFHGYQPQEVMAKFYSEASIYMQPSKKESLGISAIGALRYGVPAVVSDIGGLPEVVTHKQAGFVLPLEVETHMKAVLSLLQNTSQRIQMGEFAKKHYKNNFTFHEWKSKVSKYI